MERLLNIKEASEVLNLSIKTIYTYISARKIPVVKINSSVRFRESDLEQWVDGHYIQPLNK